MPARSRTSLAVTITVSAVGLLVLAGIASRVVHRGWRDALEDLSINVAATFAVAVLGYLIFFFRVRNAVPRQSLVTAQRDASSLFTKDLAELPVPHERESLAKALVADFVRGGYSRSTLIGGEPGSGRSAFLVLLADELARSRVLAIPVRAIELTGGSTIAQIARNRFHLRMSAAGVDDREADRMWSSLIGNGRLALVIDDLEKLNVTASGPHRRVDIASRLQELQDAGIPFFAALPRRLFPPGSTTNKVLLSTLGPDGMAKYLAERLTALGVLPSEGHFRVLTPMFTGSQASREPAQLRMSLAFAASAQGRGEEILAAFTEPRRLRRETGWLAGVCGVALGKPPLESSAEHDCLAQVGRLALIQASESVRWSQVVRGLSDERHERLLLGRAALEQREVIVIRQDHGSEVVVFRSPAVQAFAAGIGVPLTETATWSSALSRDPSEFVLGALAVSAMVLAGSSVADVFHAVRPAKSAHHLEILTALYDGFAAAGATDTLAADVNELLREVWPTGNRDDHLAFVRAVDIRNSPELQRFLWHELLPPRMARNSFRLRRELCFQLADGGDAVWETLHDHWQRICHDAFTVDLSPVFRKEAAWRSLAVGLAHMAWILPMLAERCTDSAAVQELLLTVAKGVMPPYEGYRRGDEDVPDVGLEISLAEGVKIAAVSSWHRHGHVPEYRVELLLRILGHARSWLSRMLAVQALGLSIGRTEPARLASITSRIAADRDEHPFVRAAARLVLAAGSSSEKLVSAVWLDDAEAVTSGSGVLSQEAYRLLAASTLLVNMCEKRAGNLGARTDSSGQRIIDRRGQEIRVEVLNGRELPRCMRTFRGGRSMYVNACGCDLGLCGEPTNGLRGPRHFDASFLYRASICFKPTLADVVARITPGSGVFGVGTHRTWELLQRITADNEIDVTSPMLQNEHE
ncbi:hypothetical protein Lesp02_35670 [Lentzea sp. NBRC 105346]|uniref:ATP-binding protein n=1 Tax=Lentzea sp. NBRC 105346 TaxID=3032205 RepID=UPI0024A1EE45|nr:ATP-binding protein [Lentzea sp. NBRC 105346]GLZ31379.1 hypothetical protein Lesp02_35670 [Lentzea sp. NBRC 105346]